MLLSYLLCYPHIAQNFIEEIASVNLNEPMLQNIKEKLLERLFENPDIHQEELEEAVFEDFDGLKLPEIEMLKKADKTQEEINNDILHWLHIYQIRSLQEECQNKVKEYNQTGNETLWREIQQIKQELASFSMPE